MKPYFAKYLPVEGEIKRGDIVQWGTFRGPVYAAGGKDIKKLKLFLCNRDIQLGDEITWIGRTNSTNKFGEKCKYDFPVLPHENWIKVLGEISPDATWVKERDEFNRNDFEMRWTNSKGENSLTRADVDRYSDEPILKAFIKGPCGHFH